MSTIENMSNTIRAKMKNTFPASSIIWDNDPQTNFRPDTVNFRAAIQLGEQRQVSTGGVKRFRQNGALVLQIYNPVGEGDRANLQAVDVALGTFRCRTWDEVVFSTPTLQTVGRSDKFWQVNMICPFYFDILAS